MLSMFDIAILVILVIAAGLGYIKGLYASAAGIVSFLIAIYLASQFYLPAYEFLDQNLGMQDSLAIYVKSEFPVIANIEAQAELLEQAAPLINMLLNTEDTGLFPDSLAETPLSQLISRNVLLALTFAGLYFLVRLLLSGLQWYWQNRQKKEGLGLTIRAGGALVEMIKSLVVIIILLAIFVPVIEVGALVEQKQALSASEALHESVFYKHFHPLIALVQSEISKNIL